MYEVNFSDNSKISKYAKMVEKLETIHDVTPERDADEKHTSSELNTAKGNVENTIRGCNQTYTHGLKHKQTIP